LHALVGSLGAMGVIGLGVLVACAAFYFSGLRPLERELSERRAAAERLRARASVRPAALDDRAETLRRFHALFPPLGRVPEEIERVYSLARGVELELAQGEYRLEKRATDLAAYRVTLPVRGSYAQARAFVGAVLKGMPAASVDGIRFERKKADEALLEAQVRLTLYFNPSGDLQ
jgi:hypothetical protein